MDSPENLICKYIPETIEHAFLECQKINTLWRQVKVWLGAVLKDNIKISDSEKIFGTAYKNLITDTVILLTKKRIYKNRQKGKVTNVAEIKYELSVLLRYEQYYTELEGKLPIFEQTCLYMYLIQILG